MKTKVFFTLCLAAFGFNSCLDNNSIYYYIDEPAIVMHENSDTALKTAWGIFHLSGLSDTIKHGDCLWTNFTVDTDKQPVKNRTYLHDLTYKKIGMSPVRTTSGNMYDEFNDSIKYAELYVHHIDKIIFFGFEQKGESGKYEYELICNTDSLVNFAEQNVPKLYLKSKKTGSSGPKKQHYGFDMTAFVNEYIDKNSNTVRLYLYYKSGSVAQGKDIYTSFKNSPIYWYR